MAKLTLSFKGQVQKVFYINSDVVIGRDPECSIHIDSLAVHPQHAKIRFDGERAVMETLVENAIVEVNHRRTEFHVLDHGDLIQIGKHSLLFSHDAISLSSKEIRETTSTNQPLQPDAIEGRTPMARPYKGCLQILSGNNLGRIIRLNQPITRLGAAGKHSAMIAHRDNGYYISHLEGDPPPTVQGEPLADASRRLEDGDFVQIGSIQMQFFLE